MITAPSSTENVLDQPVPRRPRWWQHPNMVGLCVLVLWSCWFALFFTRGHDPRDLMGLSDDTVRHSTISSVIRIDPTYHYHSGYDGEFCYFLALDPAHAYAYMDGPNYRYTRILYPMTARLLALGQPQLVPYTLFLVNLLAMAGGTFLLAHWLNRWRVSPWWALLFGLAPGLVLAMQIDLNEPLAYALAALGVVFYAPAPGARPRYLLAGLAFAAAALARETTLLIPLALTLSALLRPSSHISRWQALQLGVLAATPFLLYKLFLAWWLGDRGGPAVPTGTLPAPYPFAGLIGSHPPNDPIPVVAVVVAVVPALIAGGVVLHTWQRGGYRDGILFALLLQVLWLVVLVPANSVNDLLSATRVPAAIPFATLCCLPQLRGKRVWLVVCCMLWGLLLPWLLSNWLY